MEGMSAGAIEAKRSYHREYRHKNREKINAKKREWRADNKDKVQQYNREYWERRAARRLFFHFSDCALKDGETAAREERHG